MLTYFFASLPFLTALAAALTMLGSFVAGYKLTSLLSRAGRLELILWLTVASITLPVVLNPRTLNFVTEQTLLTMADFKSGFLASRLLTLTLLGLAAIEIGRGWSSRAETVHRAPLLLNAFLIYSVGTVLIQAFGSDHPDFSHKSLYALIIMTSIYFLRQTRWDTIETHLKLALLVPVAGSLAAALIAPDFALLRPYLGLLPVIDFRLFGVASHANVLGSVALLLLIIELYFPSGRYLRPTIIVSAIAVFILAQSKIAWFAAVAILALVWVPYRLAVYQALPGRAPRTLRLVVGLIVLAFFMAAAAVFVDWAALFAKHGLGTFTGRLPIWQRTIDDALHNPLFGYGAGIWDFDYRRQAGMLHVGQAHNQFVQTLGEAGLAGLTLLLGYLAVLIYFAVKLFRISRGLILALFLLLFFQSLTEAPFRIRALMDWPFFAHMLLFFGVAHFSSLHDALRQQTRRVARPASALLTLSRDPR